VNGALGIRQEDWYTKRPEFTDKKLPHLWEAADWATEEPSAAGWEKFSTAKYRHLGALALELASR
jgi:hypothetical protein